MEAWTVTRGVLPAAPITARPFFEKRGYTVVKRQQGERRGVLWTN